MFWLSYCSKHDKKDGAHKVNPKHSRHKTKNWLSLPKQTEMRRPHCAVKHKAIVGERDERVVAVLFASHLHAHSPSVSFIDDALSTNTVTAALYSQSYKLIRNLRVYNNKCKSNIQLQRITYNCQKITLQYNSIHKINCWFDFKQHIYFSKQSRMI